MNVASTLTRTVDEGVPFMNFWDLADDETPLCTIERVKCAEISGANKAEDDLVNQRLLYSIAWEPRLSSLAPRELQKICDTPSVQLPSFDSEANAMANFFPQVELALRSAAQRAQQTVPSSQTSGLPAYFSKYVDMLKFQST